MRWRGRWIGYWICDCLQFPEDWPSAVFSGVHTMIWLPMLGIFNIMQKNVNVCDYTKGLHEHHKSESALEGGYGRKSTAASWSQTCISIMPDLMLNQLNHIPTPKRAYNDCDLIWFFKKRERVYSRVQTPPPLWAPPGHEGNVLPHQRQGPEEQQQ